MIARVGDDSARRLILARRARFVAAALAGVAATAGVATATEGCGGGTDTEEQSPEPCLSVDASIFKEDAKAEPQPCLSVDASIGKEDAEAEPQPCLFAPMDDGG